ncbi:MAG: excinuclease ABC subunit A [Flavobacteriales bacterium]|nr:excinuclease ABC subunit A [Flavobacteriales bacterium]|tara:strand:- start:4811 stop:7633 length:2823 start_codon:yes stop_codon:yes gene_type:complete
MKEDKIEVIGARVHNLKNINLTIPRNQLVVFTGKSGSGKSSLAFDTIHAEGQRRYLETFNAYARQFLGNTERPEVDKITGLSPVVSIEQKTTNRNPRSTVGTITEIYDYLRLLFSRAGKAYSYNTGEEMVKYTDEQIVKLIKKEFKSKKINILSPIVRSRKGHYRDLLRKILKQGYVKVRIDGETRDLIPGMKLDRYVTHDIEIVIDRLKVKKENNNRLLSSIKTALKQGDGVLMILEQENETIRYFSKNLMCPTTGIAYKNPEPNNFSFNSPKGACKSCNGLGFHKKADLKKIIPDEKLSINRGAIASIEGQNSKWFLKQLEVIGKKFNFNLNTAIKDINNQGRHAILYGIHENFSIKVKNVGITKTYKIQFDGIINFIEEQSQLSYVKSISRWANKYMSEYNCESCQGSRLNKESTSYRIGGKSIKDLSVMDLSNFYEWSIHVHKKLNKNQLKIGAQILKVLEKRTKFILDVGLGYLTLNRSSKTLSGGESQRIRLATQIGSQLTNVLYILDEPSIGLHQRDNQKLIRSLKNLRDIGNSIIVVEHDKDMIIESDYVVDLGPEAGYFGGEITFSGSSKKFLKGKNSTSEYINGKRKIEIPKHRRIGNGKNIRLLGASGNNLKDVNLEVPLGTLTCVTGVSGSGKSTLINKTLYPILNKYFFRSVKEPLPYKKLEGLENIDKVIEIDQSPIGRSPRSNPATYSTVFSQIRNLYTSLPESKIRGYKSGRFSFNVSGGRCEECKGAGMKTIEMNFLPDVLIHCESCNGKRYNRETLEIRYKGKSISDVLDMTINQAVSHFEKIPAIYRKIKTLQDVGLGYIRLGQAATTLSGGEAQRVKLASELSKINTGNTLYILDEPTTGLHFDDIKVLLEVINKIVDQGNTVIIIEHNLDVIKTADHIIDIGPEGGEKGGMIICNGTPESIVNGMVGYTSKYLKQELQD